MRPVFLSLAIDGAPPAAGAPWLRHLPGVTRVRLVPRVTSAIGAWLDLFPGRRVSVDLAAADAARLPAGFATLAPLVRQLRIVVEGPDDIPDFVDHLRGPEGRPPFVFLVSVRALEEPPERWTLVRRRPAVFLNLVPAPDGEGAFDPGRLSLWRRSLGDRLFLSLPALAACAGDPHAGPCPTRLGMHIFVDAPGGCARPCDCEATPSVPLDEAGAWLHACDAQLRAFGEQAASACADCPVFAQCRGGCLSHRADGNPRDRFCSWLDRCFGKSS